MRTVFGAASSRLKTPSANYAPAFSSRQDVVLTAAHCVMDEASYRIVAANRAFRMQAVSVRAIAVHPAFVPGTTPRTQPGVDLAMSEACAAARARVRSLRSALSSAAITGNDRVAIVGFGLQAENRKGSARTLREAELVANGTVETANSVQIAVDPRKRGEITGRRRLPRRFRRTDFHRSARSSAPFRHRELVERAPSARWPSLCGGMTAITPLADHLVWVDTTRSAGFTGDRGRVVEALIATTRSRVRLRTSTA